VEVEETAELVDRFGWTTRSDGGRVSAHATLDLELKIWITLLTETNYGYQIRRDTDRFWFLRLTITSIRLADIRAALATIYLVQDCMRLAPKVLDQTRRPSQAQDWTRAGFSCMALCNIARAGIETNSLKSLGCLTILLHSSFFCAALALSHLALTAFRAISFLRSAVNRSARILPPFEPPSLPSATALGFFFFRIEVLRT
jgi:hypothetical protein